MSKPSPLRAARKAWKRRRFRISGMRPWTKGYVEYKAWEIERVLREGTFSSDRLPPGFGFRLDERIVEYPWLFSRLPSGPGALLDAGSVLNFDFLLKHPLLQQKNVHICTLSPESDCFWRQRISYLYEDLRSLPYRDGWFDWVVCLSTLEHVGMDNTLVYSTDGAHKESERDDYLVALRELRRVLKQSGVLYLSVPFGKALSYGWLQVFDEQMIQTVIRAFAPAAHTAHYYLYRVDGWHVSTPTESADATLFDIHHAGGYDPDFAASARAVCCLELRT